MAIRRPYLFDQLWYDMELADELDKARNGTPWRKPGESIKSARDRLRAEREAAKRRIEGGSS